MKKILLLILLFLLFPGNIIVQAISIAVIIIISTQSIKKKLKDHLKNENKQIREIKNENKNIENQAKKQETNYLKELRKDLTDIPHKEQPKTYKKSKV